MCKKLMRTAAEKEADAAASILVVMSTNASASQSWSGAEATAPITTKMPDIIAKDEPLAAVAASSGKIRALCAVAKLVHSTVHLVSLSVRLNEELAVPQLEILGVTPQPEACVAAIGQACIIELQF